MKLRWYQEECIDALTNYDYKANPIVCLPTASGKSVIIGEFIKRILQQYPHVRVMMLTHVKELIQQNADKLLTLWDNAPVGIFSAGLGQKTANAPIIFAGMQSVIKYIEKQVKENQPHFGFINLIVVDECHLISEKDTTSYRKIITELSKINPNLKVVGLTATPYRMKGGHLLNCGIFGDIAYNLCKPEDFIRLIKEGYLSKLINKQTSYTIDTSKVGSIGGDYNLKELDAVTDTDEQVYNAVKEIVELGTSQNRKSWIVFGTSIEHCEHLCSMFENFGIEAATVHSKHKSKENDHFINEFKQGRIRCLINNDKLTTGFDHPSIDLVGVLRATQSVTLWQQMVGRGFRVAEGKNDCLVLDYGGNTKRLGAVNDPVLPSGKKKKKGESAGIAPVKICPKCGCYNHARARLCEVCNHEFPVGSNLTDTVSSLELIKDVADNEPVVEPRVVHNVYYLKHISPRGTTQLKVTYQCGIEQFVEYIGFEQGGHILSKAILWWQQRSALPVPKSVDEALMHAATLKKPMFVNVKINVKYPEIINVIF